ncbi:MAG: flagellar filament capping protein FliD, partial [Oscillibacter sp.]|nr:flagellar filament capping protein FliD [Oscillibacter sp.]
ENSVSGYKTRITQLQQEQTKYEWKQDAYRGITDKMYDLTQKYTSFTSRTNLLSNAFFNNSISTTVSGPDGVTSKVSATGRSSSDIQLLAAQTATAASYSVAASALGLNVSNTTTNAIGTNPTDVPVGTLKGTMTINYDGKKIDLTFDETDQIDGTSKTLAQAITEKLENTTVNTGYGTQKASELINVGTDSGGNITFSDKGNRGANPYVSYLDSSMKTALGATDSPLYTGSSNKQYTFAGGNRNFVDSTKTVADYLSGKDISVTVDGTTKTFRLDKTAIQTNGIQEALRQGINGLGLGITAADDGNKLSFSVGDTSNFSISVKDERASALLGLSSGVSNYLDTKSTIGNLIGSDTFDQTFTRAVENDATVKSRLKAEGNYYRDATTGNLYQKRGNDYYHVSDDQNHSPLYELKINDKSIYVAKDASLESVLTGINNSDMGVKASYSKLTGKLVFTAKETGVNGDISLDNDLSKALFGTKTNQLTLGDVLGDEWFDANGEVTLYTGSTQSAALSATNPKGTYTRDSSLNDFLTSFNKIASNAQFYDSSNPADSHNRNAALTGYNVTFGAAGSGTESAAAKYYLTNKDPNVQGMTLQEFAERINSANVTRGTDATVRALVNGELTTLTRASNTIDMDGMKVTLSGSFNADSIARDANGNVLSASQQPAVTDTERAGAVSFNTSAGSDELMTTITSFVNDYNAVLKQLHDAYATQPAEKNSSTHARYDPLTDDDKSSMSEKAVESYEAKAKQGILFGDSDLRAAYESLVRAISPSGNDGAALRNMGIETTYSGGLTQIKLDESKLRDALSRDPDSVRDAFTKSKEYGASSDGLMTSIKEVMERYSSTSIASPGILVKKAGSTYSSTSLLSNAVQTQIDSVQKKIEQWQSKMSTKIDYYTRQFTALEKLMNTMNSQSSALSGLMGGY